MTNVDAAPCSTLDSLSVLVPVYNSEKTIEPLVEKVIDTLTPHFSRLEVVLVNDGSPDGSHEKALAVQRRHPDTVRYIRLARNFGEHNAVMCGLHYVSCDAVAIIDDDFQHEPEEILKLVGKLGEGYDVVYSYFSTKEHHWFRNLGSRFTNWVATYLLRKPRGLYLSSFKVMNRFLIDTVTCYEGPYPYLDGLILRSTSSIGTQLCEHHERVEGTSNYTFRRLVRLWLNMFTSFSVTPLRISSVLGLIMAACGLLMSIVFVLSYYFEGLVLGRELPPGWASIIVASTLFSGIQLCVLGMIGEYLGRLFLTENRHPQFVVRETHGTDRDPARR